MATSWAKISRVSTKEICHAITWLGTCIFAKHYCLDLTGSSFRTAAQFLRHRCTCPPRAKSTLNTVFSPPRPLPLNFASSVGSVVLVPQLYLGTRLQVVNLGFPLCDALHPLGCTPVFARKKKKKTIIGCLPAPALCLHHVFHVGPFSGVTPAWQSCYRTLRGVRVGVALLSVSSAWNFPVS